LRASTDLEQLYDTRIHELVTTQLLTHYHKAASEGDRERPFIADDFSEHLTYPRLMCNLLQAIERQAGDNHQLATTEGQRDAITKELMRCKWQTNPPEPQLWSCLPHAYSAFLHHCTLV